MDSENKTKLGYELTDYGTLLFEYNSNIKENAFYISSEKRKANFKSPFFYYIISIPFVMIAWFIASIISAARLEGEDRWLHLGLTLGSLIPMAISCFLAIMTAFGFWGKLHDKKNRGALNKKENYLRVYQDYIVIKKNDVTSVFLRSEIRGIELKWDNFIRLIFDNYKSEIFFLEIPENNTSAKKLQKLFGDQLTLVKYNQYYRESINFNSWSKFLVEMIFTVIAIGIGVALICMHVYMHLDIPIILGVIFIGGGLILLCDSFSFIPVIKDIVTPFAIAALIIAFPWGLVGTLHQVLQLGEGFKVFTVFSPFSCFAVIISSVSVLLIAGGISAIRDYIRYGHKRGKKRRLL